MRHGPDSHWNYGLRQLAKECLLPDTIMAEIGVFAGQSTRIFLETGNVKILWAIDPWIDNYDPQDPAPAPMALARKAFEENIAEFQDKVIVYADCSVKVALLAPEGYFDLVYIDANHQYKHVKQDILAWMDKIRPGGIIAGHDYSVWPGVEKAVQEILGKPDKIYPDYSWIKRL